VTQLISGHTRLIAHLGVPTESFKAPMIYNPYFEERGIDAVVMPMGCEAADFPALLPLLFRLRNIAGALITMPHKVTAASIVGRISVTAQVCGSCNAVRREPDGTLTGDMFDGVGFVRGMVGKGARPEAASAIISGCGGVGSGIAASLAAAGAARISLFDNKPEAGEALARRLRRFYPSLAVSTGSNDPAGFDIVVNATPLGMADDDPLPFEVERIEPRAFVGEVVMKREETPFLAAARERGCRTQIGTDMLFEQIPAYLDFFGFPSATPDELRILARISY
jgi:shikimate dehydrogenase